MKIYSFMNAIIVPKANFLILSKIPKNRNGSYSWSFQHSDACSIPDYLFVSRNTNKKIIRNVGHSFLVFPPK